MTSGKTSNGGRQRKNSSYVGSSGLGQNGDAASWETLARSHFVHRTERRRNGAATVGNRSFCQGEQRARKNGATRLAYGRGRGGRNGGVERVMQGIESSGAARGSVQQGQVARRCDAHAARV
jgi:hypothetical protein